MQGSEPGIPPAAVLRTDFRRQRRQGDRRGRTAALQMTDAGSSNWLAATEVVRSDQCLHLF